MKFENMMKVFVLCVVVGLMGSLVSAAPAKDIYDGKTVGNSGFANIVSDDITGNVNGWVHYTKEGDCLTASWHIKGLEKSTSYQLKIHSVDHDERLLLCEENPGMCGDVDGGTYLVMDVVDSKKNSGLRHNTKECRLPSGDYSNIMFLLTKDEAAHQTAHTWQNSGEISSFTIN